jgi:glycerophosphoryl diester phosphodiesterase
MDIVHRANTLDSFYKYYYIHHCRAFEIDVQSGGDTIVVFHDDFTNRIPNDQAILTLEEFLRCTPNSIVINIEIKRYTNSRNINQQLIHLLSEYPLKKYMLSSFDKQVCQELSEFRYPVLYLFSSMDDYDDSFVNICVPKALLENINMIHHEQIYVYHVEWKQLDFLKRQYPFVDGWIYDD